jgi:hypothetical protein
MSIFNEVNQDGINAFIALMQSDGVIAMQPIPTDEDKVIFNSGDTVSKAERCAQLLIQWQNNLNESKANPISMTLFNKKKFNLFIKSQKTLNKLKRKFTKLLIANMAFPQREMLTKEAANRLGLPTNDVMLISHLFQHYGDDSLCLELIAPYAKHHLNASIYPKGKLISFGDGSDGYQISNRLIFPVSSAAEHFPLAANAWGYRGQEISAMTAYAPNKADAVKARLTEMRNRSLAESPQSPWESVLQRSDFTRAVQLAKFFDGCPIGNCSELTDYKFRKIVKQRQFDLVLEAEFQPNQPADHVWIISEDPVYQGRHILDAWNGPKIYAEKDTEKYLEGYVSTNINDGTANLVKFDPKLHHVKTTACSIFPLEEFKRNSKTKHLYLIQLLKEFHEIPKQQYKEKMLKGMEIVRFIENRMPLYEYTDPAVHELYDQMVYLTKKEKKRGLALPPLNEKERCLVNEALQNLDLPGLENHLKQNQPMDSITIYHAIKASLRANNIQFLKAVVDGKVPMKSSSLTTFYHSKPEKAITLLADRLYKASNALDLRPLCKKATMNRQSSETQT